MLLIKVDNSCCLLLIVPHPPCCWRANTLRFLMSRCKLFLVSRLLLLTSLVLYSEHSLLVEILRRWLLRSFVLVFWFLNILVISLILWRHRDLNICLLIVEVILIIEFNRFLKLLLSLCFTDLINLILLNFFMVRDGCQLDECVVWKMIFLTVEFLKQGLG